MAAMLACGCRSPEDSDAVIPNPTEGDTGSFDTGIAAPPPVDTWSSGIIGGWEGYELCSGVVDGEPVVLVGAPSTTLDSYYADSAPAVTAFEPDADSLGWIGGFVDHSRDAFNSGFGGAVAIASDGTGLAIAAPESYVSAERRGRVYVLSELPRGIVEPEPGLLIEGTEGPRTTLDGLGFLDLDGSGDRLGVGANIPADTLPGNLYVFDRELAGVQGLGAASITVSGSDRNFGGVEGWDSDGDGLDELVSTSETGILHFASPLPPESQQSDADVAWTDPLAVPADLGIALESVDDLDGDGLPELAIGAATRDGPEFRSGALYIVPGGPLVSSPTADLAVQFQGVGVAEGLGRSVTTGDFDGDGQLDLAIGAYHVNDPYLPGQVLGYLGPIGPGLRTSPEADFVATGQYPFDWFGSGIAAVDADGDAQSDLVVGAQGWNNGTGKIYLFRGSDLVP